MTAAAVTEMMEVRSLIEALNVLRLESETGRAIFNLSFSATTIISDIGVGKVHAFTAQYRPAMPKV